MATGGHLWSTGVQITELAQSFRHIWHVLIQLQDQVGVVFVPREYSALAFDLNSEA